MSLLLSPQPLQLFLFVLSRDLVLGMTSRLRARASGADQGDTAPAEDEVGGEAYSILRSVFLWVGHPISTVGRTIRFCLYCVLLPGQSLADRARLKPLAVQPTSSAWSCCPLATIGSSPPRPYRGLQELRQRHCRPSPQRRRQVAEAHTHTRSLRAGAAADLHQEHPAQASALPLR